MPKRIDHRKLYRLPWTLVDNGISWLEPTALCNLHCDGCYRRNRAEHKSFEQTLRELDIFDRVRNADALSIAGGDPLLYPDLVKTVAEAKRRGYKPVVNTNGHGLTRELLHDLKRAGLAGFTFHIDSYQGRRDDWQGKNELELNELREYFAELAAEFEVGCSFNATIYPDTVQYVGPLSQWAKKHMDKVQVMVFIIYRDLVTRGYRYFIDHNEVQPHDEVGKPVAYNLDVEKAYERPLTAEDLVAELQRDDPDYAPAAYLNGTEDPTSFKWLLAGRMGCPGKSYGYVGPKIMELIQTTHHLFTNKYLAYNTLETAGGVKPLLLLAPIDAGMRRIVQQALKDYVRRPLRALTDPVYFQSVLIIQPIDMLPDGRMNMCDGCPDITVWQDRLVWSCRMDEQERYGENLSAKPQDDP